MKKQYFLLVFTLFTLCLGKVSFAQIVGTNAFLQGHWVEIGEITNGAFGTGTSPVGYHAHPGFGTGLGEVYDYGHDGWTVGTPTHMGDYTLPGFPTEGWSIQVNGQYNNAWQAGGFPGTGTLTGTITGYTNVGGSARSMWTGTASGGNLSIKQETRVDTQASWCVVTTKLYNTSGATIPDVYVGRTCDPDNDESWPGGSFTTTNVIVHQNDIDHRVQVSAVGPTGPISYMAMGTKDCRAKCYVCQFGLTPINQLDQLWAGTGGASGYTYAGTYTNDVGYGVVFKIGNIAAGDSAVVAVAYIFNNDNGIDSAFREPSARIAGGTLAQPPVPFPNVVIDTYDACANPGLTLVPVDLVFAEDVSWTWSKWTWSPSTGLSSTTGAHVMVTTTVLPPVITYTVTGTDPATCGLRTMYITFITCNNVRCNNPCYGDSLLLKRVGDSTGCTYYWYGPGGFTSTLQYPWKYPATYSDSGMYYVVRTLLGAHDTDSIRATIHYTPVVTAANNGPLCEGMVDTLLLTVSPTSPGETYDWVGPPAFTSALQNPTRPGFVDADTGVYRVIVTTPFGCKDTAYTTAHMIPQPPPPIITDPDPYCQGSIFVPFTVTGLVPGATLYWFTTSTGGTGVTTPPSIPTSAPGLFHVWASQKVGSCESQRGHDSVRIVTMPVAPPVTGTNQYCQYIGPVVPLTVSPATSSATFNWYTVATGGVTGVHTEPLPNINSSGTFNYWVSQTDSGCEGPRTHVTITIHPKPAPPIITPTPWCQYQIPSPVVANPSGAGDILKWYGPGVIPGSLIAPTPPTNTAPDTITYYVTETSVYGCVSDSAVDKVVIKRKPDLPITGNTKYCQHAAAAPLNLLVDSSANSHLNWYYNTHPLTPTPVPFTDTIPGTYTWWVSQTINGCEGDSAAVKITIIYKPVFSIEVSSPWVCQFDSIRLAYKGPSLFAPDYKWTLPGGAFAANHTDTEDSLIVVRFDSANQNNYVYLHTSNDSGFCYSDTSVWIKVIPQPWMTAYTKPDVCLGDTVQLALDTRSANAYEYKWYVDNVVITSSGALNIVTANSSSGGPFVINWLDSGQHIIRVTTVTQEGCKSAPSYDSVLVHTVPDAGFMITSMNTATFCLEDSIEFTANASNYNYSYAWEPARYFDNVNKPKIWGKMGDAHSIVTLTVTDPYGCYATQSLQVDPGSCCTLAFPNAFTPNGDNKNDEFRPYYDGYHRFHVFRIANRWGQTIFESANSTDARWDGNFNGVPQDMGVYYYYIKYDCGGKSIEQKGDVTLIR